MVIYDYFSRNKRTKLIAVAGPGPSVQHRGKKKYHPEVLVSNYKEAMGRDDIDIVVGCTPHNLHYPIVMESLQAGKNVICEKPLAITVKEADEMINAAEQAGKQLLITLNMRFDSCAIKIREMIQKGRLGKIFMACSAYLGYEVERLNDPKSWKGDLRKAGGWVLLDGGYHIVDFMNSCLGPAKSVSAMGGRYVIKASNKGEDNISLLVEYQNNCVANLQISFTACSPGSNKTPTLTLRHEFLGDKGTLSACSRWDPIRGSYRKFELLTPGEFEKLIWMKIRSRICWNIYWSAF